ncbi:MAG: indole-3-glycerol phosphate synthase [Salinirussus sp.]
MGSQRALAPAVESILDAARDRGGGDRIAVDARSFPAAFDRAEADGRAPVIAEVKPTSPTTDGIHDLDPVEAAESMVAGGAAALSVLTEPDHFGGSADTLRRVRSAVDVPVLRKDFVLKESQLDTVAADGVLLIARFVDDLERTVAAARDRGFTPLVEVHSTAEAKAALAADARFVGVNNRDLARLEVDHATFERVAPVFEGEPVTLVAESGLETVEDVERMREAGADAVLIGSAIMDGDVRTNTRRLTGAGT